MKYLLAPVVMLLAVSAAHAQAVKPAAKPGWITASNKPCKIWNPAPAPNESVTWSGPCENGFANGKGVLKWTENGKPDAVFEGTYYKGKRNGAGVITLPDGQRQQGIWVNDEPVPFTGDSI